MRRDKAVTLAEILVVIALSVLLFIGLMNLFGSGLKGSAKALTIQDNMEAANILMSQIELDLLRATDILDPGNNQESNCSARWIHDSKSEGGSIQYIYDYQSGSQEGVLRKVTGSNVNIENRFAKNHLIDLKFKHFAIETDRDEKGKLIIEQHGMWIELTVYSKDKNDKDSFTLKRLVPIKQPI